MNMNMNKGGTEKENPALAPESPAMIGPRGFPLLRLPWSSDLSQHRSSDPSAGSIICEWARDLVLGSLGPVSTYLRHML